MTQVIMLFLFPIGLYFYFFVERKNNKEYQDTFDDFQRDIRASRRLSQEEKMEDFKLMLMNNEYKIIREDEMSIEGEKKIFSMSLFTMSVGFFYVGVVIYLLYFYYFQKPHLVRYSL
ncbi:hypothetical protein MNB_SV-13-970 [hydrothermal vent metagenome]|uniref:Uncharacterized protein n=1 Tax=hydrothermal vent metagenome TaxID=652676 RepID=A0A1W1BWQ8_9ZZZZ